MRAARVTNGQRAAVCGLVIAGLPMEAACRILGVPYAAMVALLPHDWATMTTRLWSVADLADMRARWLAGETSGAIGKRHGVKHWTVRRIAAAEGWPMRRPPRRRLPQQTGMPPARGVHHGGGPQP